MRLRADLRRAAGAEPTDRPGECSEASGGLLARCETMGMEQYIRAIAGVFVLLSLTLGYLHSPYWHLFTAFVGLNLLQSAFTRWCLMENILEKAGIAERPST
jgi:hypothetical protein